VRSLILVQNSSPFFEAVLQDGTMLTARNVVLALGFRYFKIYQSPILLYFHGAIQHTCDLVNLAA
jgi:hypothetical protein